MVKDYFSTQSDQYRRFRPNYPRELFSFLAEQSQRDDLAWDCATGNGQAAVSIAEHFSQVIATDISAEQIKNAQPHPKIKYRIAAAEESQLPGGSVDLIAVAQALHWLHLPDFYREVRRVARNKALIAVWGYGAQQIDSPLDALIMKYYSDIVDPFWPPERLHIETSYSNLPFPFAQLPTPTFSIAVNLSCNDFLGYLNSWSATRRFQDARGYSPLRYISEELYSLWGSEKRRVVWPLFLQIGRI